MNILEAAILGIVEGVTEFLPISSTAHLEIVSRLIGLTQTNFVKSFEIAIQLGAILAVVLLYAKYIFKNLQIWKPIMTAFLPTATIGFALYKIIKHYFLGNNWLIVGTLFFGGLILIWFEQWGKRTSDEKKLDIDPSQEIAGMKTSTAIWIGLAQALAVMPGVSRSAATIIAGRLLGLSRVTIVEFSFLLAIPTMAAATGYDLLKNANSFSKDQFGLLTVGFITAFIFALLSIKFLLRYIKNHSFVSFGIYRIVVAMAFAIFLLN